MWQQRGGHNVELPAVLAGAQTLRLIVSEFVRLPDGAGVCATL